MTNKQKIIRIALVIFLALISFVLGRLSNSSLGQSSSDISILTATSIQQAVDSARAEENTVQIRASSRGTKYYFPWCQSTFSEVNTIYFESEEKAIEAGYEKATNCISEN